MSKLSIICPIDNDNDKDMCEGGIENRGGFYLQPPVQAAVDVHDPARLIRGGR